MYHATERSQVFPTKRDGRLNLLKPRKGALITVRHNLAVKNEWLKPSEKVPSGLLLDIKSDPFERTPETPGHFTWMKEKTWVVPQLAGPFLAHLRSLKDFPPRQAGTGIGAQTLGVD